MLDIQLLRSQPEEVARRLATRGDAIDFDAFNTLEAERKTLQQRTQDLQAQRNTLSKQIGMLKGKGEDASAVMAEVGKLGDELKASEARLAELLEAINDFTSALPNLPGDDVPVGADENDNVDMTAWQQFIYRAMSEGISNKKHMDFAQKVWNLMEEMKPAAQKAHYEMYGHYFNEITADPITTPFGDYEGGYVPAVTDMRLVPDSAMRNEQETQAVDNSYMFPTTGRGFTKGRVEYNKPLLLDLNFLMSHIDKVLRFTNLEPAIKDVARIVKNDSRFGDAMNAFDPTVRNDMLVPWLQRTAQQLISMPTKGWGGKAIDTVFTYLRSTTGLQMMVGNFVNALQQYTGLSISALKADGHIRPALWRYIRQSS